MKTKLTLTIEPELVEEVKAIAAERKISLSQMVEKYFAQLSDSRKRKRVDVSKKYLGILKDTPFAKMSDEELKRVRYEDRYLRE